jgi:two-component system, sensor histidine kinase and response regulator
MSPDFGDSHHRQAVNTSTLGPLKILIVDDDDQSLRMLCLILGHEGHHIKTASNGLEAVEAVKLNELDLVLMDVQMPLMDGLDATRQIRAWEGQERHLAVVGLTAVLDSEFQKCMQAGMDGIIAKPFDTEDFHELINGFVNKNRVSAKQKMEGNLVDLLVLDVQGAIKRFAGDEGNYKLLLEEFVLSLPKKFEELVGHFEASDWKNLSRRAHNLKGLSAGFGAVELSHKALELDNHVNENQYDLAREKIIELGTSIASLKMEALNFIGNHPVHKDNELS